MKKINKIIVWLNWHLSGWTHPNKPQYRQELYYKYCETFYKNKT